jgi:hypothetical protein
MGRQGFLQLLRGMPEFTSFIRSPVKNVVQSPVLNGYGLRWLDRRGFDGGMGVRVRLPVLSGDSR